MRSRSWLVLQLAAFLAGGVAAAAPARKAAPLPKVHFTGRKVDRDGFQQLHFTLKPAARAPGWVFSDQVNPQEPQPKEVIWPFYRIELLRNGKWEDQSPGWCLIGAINAEVQAGSRRTFTVPEPEGDWQALRAGVFWIAADATATRGGSVVWSEPVRPARRPAGNR